MKERSTRSIAASLGRLSARWLNPRFVFRRKAVKRLVARSGFSEKMSEAMMDAVFSELTEAKLQKLLRSEFKDPRALDEWTQNRETGAWLRARGPGSILHIFSANAPQAAVLSFVLGMLLKSRNLGKPSSRDEGFLDIYLQSLKKTDRPLWRMNTLLDPQDRPALSASLKSVGLVAAYGSDESLEQIRRRAPVTTPFFAYGHRLSAALYLKEALDRKNTPRSAALTAQDVWMADQRGCLSPMTLYAQKGGSVSPEEFAAKVARELQKRQRREKKYPRRGVSAAAAAYDLRHRHMLQSIQGGVSALWESSPRGLWAVVYGEDLRPSVPDSRQTLTVRGFKSAEEVFLAMEPVQRYLQCVSLECAAKDRKKTAERLSALGVNRICRAGSMQRPPATWHHDGKPGLAGWVRWTDLEHECARMFR